MVRYNRNFGRPDENGNIEYAPIPLVIGEKNIWTNVPDTHHILGYYLVESTDAPSNEGFYYTPYWVLEEDKCVQKWEEHEVILEPEAGYVSEESIQAAIKEGVNSI